MVFKFTHKFFPSRSHLFNLFDAANTGKNLMAMALVHEQHHWRQLQWHQTTGTRTLTQSLDDNGHDERLEGFHRHTRYSHGTLTPTHKQHNRSYVDSQMTLCTREANQMSNTHSMFQSSVHLTVWPAILARAPHQFRTHANPPAPTIDGASTREEWWPKQNKTIILRAVNDYRNTHHSRLTCNPGVHSKKTPTEATKRRQFE